MTSKFLIFATLLLTIPIVSGCSHNNLKSSEDYSREKTLTVGTVQKEIKKGMSQAEVASTLGSPNIVTSEKEGYENWIYDKVSSEVDYSKTTQYGTLILIGASSNSRNIKSTQKT
jgi:outer membrane protein assembly factor BamE (lipoprotein component of BamABCDE complex)